MVKKIEPILIGLLVFWTPLVFFTRAADGFTLPKEIVACAALVLILVPAFFEARNILWRSWLIRLAVLFLAWMLLDSLAVGLLKIEVLKGSIHIFLLVGSLLAVVVTCAKGYSYERFLHYALLAGALMALYGILQSAGGDHTQWDTMFERRAFSTLGNPDYLGGHLVGLLPLAFVFVLRSTHRTGWLWFRAVTLLLLVGLFLTRVRGAELSLLASLVFLVGAFFSPWGRGLAKENFRFLLAAFGIMAGLGWAFIARHGGLSSFGFSQVTVQQRLDTWKVAWEMVKDHPLTGIGLGQVGIQFPRYQYRPFAGDPLHPYILTEHIHNEFLQFWVEGGLPGLLLFLGLLGAFLTGVNRYVKNPQYPEPGKELLIGVTAGLVALLAQSLSNFPLQIAPTAVVFGFYLAAPLALRPVVPSAGGTPASTGRLSGVEIGATLLGLLIVLLVGARTVGSSIAFRDTVGETSLAKASNAVYFANRLSHLSSWDPKVWPVVGRALELGGQKDLALAAYNQAALLNPNDAQSLVDAADLQAKSGQLSEALDLCQRAEAVAPNFSGPFWIEAFCHYNLNQYAEAVPYFEKFIQFFPNNDQAYTALGLCESKLNKKVEAMAAWKKAVALNPNNLDAIGFLKKFK